MTKLGWVAISWLALLIALLIILPLILLMSWLSWAHFVQSPLYAAKYFEGLVKIEDLQESRRWHWGSHPWADDALGCTYAIATLPDDRPIEPPSKWSDMWEDTPVRIPDGQHDVLNACTYLWPDSLVTRLQNAHDQPESFYSYGRQTLLLYSPAENIVARIHFGD